MQQLVWVLIKLSLVGVVAQFSGSRHKSVGAGAMGCPIYLQSCPCSVAALCPRAEVWLQLLLQEERCSSTRPPAQSSRFSHAADTSLLLPKLRAGQQG